MATHKPLNSNPVKNDGGIVRLAGNVQGSRFSNLDYKMSEPKSITLVATRSIKAVSAIPFAYTTNTPVIRGVSKTIGGVANEVILGGMQYNTIRSAALSYRVNQMTAFDVVSGTPTYHGSNGNKIDYAADRALNIPYRITYNTTGALPTTKVY